MVNLIRSKHSDVCVLAPGRARIHGAHGVEQLETWLSPNDMQALALIVRHTHWQPLVEIRHRPCVHRKRNVVFVTPPTHHSDEVTDLRLGLRVVALDQTSVLQTVSIGAGVPMVQLGDCGPQLRCFHPLATEMRRVVIRQEGMRPHVKHCFSNFGPRRLDITHALGSHIIVGLQIPCQIIKMRLGGWWGGTPPTIGMLGPSLPPAARVSAARLGPVDAPAPHGDTRVRGAFFRSTRVLGKKMDAHIGCENKNRLSGVRNYHRLSHPAREMHTR